MKKLRKKEIIGFIFTAVLGTLLHFTYNWSGKNGFVALFSAVNESTWEHLKLLFIPAAIFGVIEYFTDGRELQGFLTVKAAGIWVGMLSVVVLYYTYTGIIGRNFMWLDILIFFIGCAVISLYTLKYANRIYGSNFAGILLLIVSIIAFFVFTYFPLDIGLFRVP